MARMRANCSANSDGLSLLVIQPSAYFATRRNERSTMESGALAPCFHVSAVGLEAIQMGSGVCTGLGWSETFSNR